MKTLILKHAAQVAEWIENSPVKFSTPASSPVVIHCGSALLAPLPAPRGGSLLILEVGSPRESRFQHAWGASYPALGQRGRPIGSVQVSCRRLDLEVRSEIYPGGGNLEGDAIQSCRGE